MDLPQINLTAQVRYSDLTLELVAVGSAKNEDDWSRTAARQD